MSWLSRLQNVARADRVSDEIDREMAFHLAQRADELVSAGLSLDDARAEARRRFGNPGVVRDRTRDRDLFVWLENFVTDVRYALRGLRAAPVFTTVAIISLSMGIGANTAIFTAINALVLRPLPVTNADELLYVTSGREETFSYLSYQQFRDGVPAVAALSAIERGVARHEFGAGNAVEKEVVRAPAVTGNFFATLGVQAALGRTINVADDREDAAAAVVISDGFWRRRFGADSSVVGSVVQLDNLPATVVGVMPAGFVGFDAGSAADLWWPIQLVPRLGVDANWRERLTSNGVTWLVVFGRLRSGQSRDQAYAEFAAVFRQGLEVSTSGSAASAFDRQRILDQKIELHKGNAGYVRVRSAFKQPLLVLMSVVALVLLVACMNIAGLLLVRAAAREREFALRAALGGGRGRIVRQLLTESFVLSMAGGVAGFLMARWATLFLSAYLPKDEITVSLAPDLRVLLFVVGISLLTGALFGLAPALRLIRLDLARSIKSHGGQSQTIHQRRFQSLLVVTQIAISMLLLVPAGLFGRTLYNLKQVDLGFTGSNLIGLSVDISRIRPTPGERSVLEHRLLAALEALPGAESATITGAGLLSGNGYSTEFSVPGYVTQTGEELRAYAVLAGPRFFETMQVPLLRGREFQDSDDPASQIDAGKPALRVVILGAAMAQKYFGASNPVGREILLKDKKPATIIGVAGDTKYDQDLRGQTPLEIYLPYYGGGVRMPSTVYLRASGPLSSLPGAIQHVVAEVNPRMTVRRLTTMQEMLDRAVSKERLIAQLVGFFSVFVVLLASLGLYGLISFSAARRTREFGVRIALGANVRDLLSLVLSAGLKLAVMGCALGIVGAIVLMRTLGSLLYGVSPADPPTLVTVMLVLLSVSILACWLPARRAARVDANVALRSE